MNTATIKTAEERATEMAAAGLQEVNQQLLRSEIQDVATKCDLARNTVVSYLAGNVADVKRAAKIISVSRQIILKREQTLSA